VRFASFLRRNIPADSGWGGGTRSLELLLWEGGHSIVLDHRYDLLDESLYDLYVLTTLFLFGKANPADFPPVGPPNKCVPY